MSMGWCVSVQLLVWKKVSNFHRALICPGPDRIAANCFPLTGEFSHHDPLSKKNNCRHGRMLHKKNDPSKT